ncbi:hypothetical protein HPP92_004531 [Vanilla planifolia]|uniref:Uncharacterized protein n=1 Tax=Vanilla planifolia TaxID=51239 RepID=A0A835VCD4_VANPL|nr:hypothetical protein HPP92_004531 [Vanilla planifolia]
MVGVQKVDLAPGEGVLGSLSYGTLLRNLHSRGDVIAKIKGCAVDSGAAPEISSMLLEKFEPDMVYFLTGNLLMMRKLQVQEYLNIKQLKDANQFVCLEEYVEQLKRGLAISISYRMGRPTLSPRQLQSKNTSFNLCNIMAPRGILTTCYNYTTKKFLLQQVMDKKLKDKRMPNEKLVSGVEGKGLL